MTKRLVKDYGRFERDDFLQAIRDEYDNYIITYKGNDYMFDLVYSRKDKRPSWYLSDALEFLTQRHPTHVAGPFESIDDLLSAPILDGRSIVDRYDELGTCDTFHVVDGSE